MVDFIILHKEWAKRLKNWDKAYELEDKLDNMTAGVEKDKLDILKERLRLDADDGYLNAVTYYFGNKAIIEWEFGQIHSDYRVPIPIGEFYG